MIEGQLYLVRAGFFYGNYDGKNSPPEFRLYLGVNFWQAVETLSDNTVLAEIIVLSPANALEVCLVKTGTGTPFISVLEVRLVQNSVYKIVNGSQSLVLRGDRVDYGGNQSTRSDSLSSCPIPISTSLWFLIQVPGGSLRSHLVCKCETDGMDDGEHRRGHQQY